MMLMKSTARPLADYPAPDDLHPAKDEGETHPDCIQSALTQEYPGSRGGIDDRSTMSPGRSWTRWRRECRLA